MSPKLRPVFTTQDLSFSNTQTTNPLNLMSSVRKLYGYLVEKLSTDNPALSVIVVISLVILFRMGLTDNVFLSDSPFVIVDEGYAGAQIHFNISYPMIPCEFANIEFTDGNATNNLNVTKYFRKYSIDPTGSDRLFKPVMNVSENVQIVDKEDGTASVVLNSENFERIKKKHAILVVLFDTVWCFWDKMKPSWEQAAKIIRERYDPKTDGRILLGHVDCSEEQDLCKRYGVWFCSYASIFRNASDVIVEYNAKSYEPYQGKRDTESLVKAMEDLVAPIPLQWRRGCRIEGTLRLKRMPRNLYLSASSGSDGKRVTTEFKPMFKKFLGFYY